MACIGALGLIALASPFYLFPAASRWAGLLFLPAAAILGWIILRKPLPASPLNLPLLLISVTMLISAYASYDLSVSLPKLAGLLLGIAIFIATSAYSANPKLWKIGFYILILVGVAVSLMGLVGMQWPLAEAYSKFPALYRLAVKIPFLLNGLPGAEDGFNPNEVAGTLLWSILPAIALFASLGIAYFFRKFKADRPFRKLLEIFFLGICLLVMTIVFVLSQSRGGYIGLGISFLIAIFLLLPSPKRRRFRLLAIGSGLLIVGLAIFTLFQSSNNSSSDALTSATGLLTYSSFSLRYQFWTYGIQTLRDFPLTGIGMNTFRYIVFSLFPAPCVVSGCDLAHVHNEVLQVGLDLGIPGLIAFLSLYFASFWMLFKLYNEADQTGIDQFSLKLLILGLAGALFSHFIYGITDAVALGAKPGFVFWLLLGLISGLYQQHFRNSDLKGSEL